MLKFIYETCGAVCHQLPARSLNAAVPFCARCSGIYFNALLALIFLISMAPSGVAFSRIRWLWWAFAASCGVLLAAWTLPFAVQPVPLSLTFISGIPFAWTGIMIIYHYVSKLFWTDPKKTVFGSKSGFLLLCLAATNFLVFFEFGGAAQIISVSSFLGAVTGYGMLNVIILLNVFGVEPRDHRALRGFFTLLLAGALLAVLEMNLYGLAVR